MILSLSSRKLRESLRIPAGGMETGDGERERDGEKKMYIYDMIGCYFSTRITFTRIHYERSDNHVHVIDSATEIRKRNCHFETPATSHSLYHHHSFHFCLFTPPFRTAENKLSHSDCSFPLPMEFNANFLITLPIDSRPRVIRIKSHKVFFFLPYSDEIPLNAEIVLARVKMISFLWIFVGFAWKEEGKNRN